MLNSVNTMLRLDKDTKINLPSRVNIQRVIVINNGNSAAKEKGYLIREDGYNLFMRNGIALLILVGFHVIEVQFHKIANGCLFDSSIFGTHVPLQSSAVLSSAIKEGVKRVVVEIMQYESTVQTEKTFDKTQLKMKTELRWPTLHLAIVLKDCIGDLKDSMSEIKDSLKALSGISKSYDKNFVISNAQTWTSAAITDENSCLDGFSDRKVNVSTAVYKKIRNSIASDDYILSSAGFRAQRYVRAYARFLEAARVSDSHMSSRVLRHLPEWWLLQRRPRLDAATQSE
ncbi:pectinesterase inhibitor 4-like protein [Tanacetum coccineum]